MNHSGQPPMQLLPLEPVWSSSGSAWAEEVIARRRFGLRGPTQSLPPALGGNPAKEQRLAKWLRGNDNVLIFDRADQRGRRQSQNGFIQCDRRPARETKVIYASGEFRRSWSAWCGDRNRVLWDGRIVAEIAGAEARKKTFFITPPRSSSVSKAGS